MAEIAIKIDNLSKVYKLYDRPIDRMKEALSFSRKKYSREHYALKDISLEIAKGETIGIVGTNGSGKSTLLKIITGVLTQSTGTLQVNGKISALLELGAGFNPEYTGMENIYLNGTMMGYTKEQMDERVKKIRDFADIGEFIYQPVKTYSSGMFARLAFAVAINVDPDILIVDESLSVGDIRFQIKCMDKMAEMMNGGTTVLFVSHDVNAVKRFCTRVIWLNNGKLQCDGEVNKVTDEYSDFMKFGEIANNTKKNMGNNPTMDKIDVTETNKNEAPCNETKENKEKNSTMDKIDITEINKNEAPCNKTKENKEKNPTVDKIDITKTNKNEAPYNETKKNIIAEICGFDIYNMNDKKITSANLKDKIKVKVTYNVYDDSIENPVLGVAIRSISNEYICGLNTLLDKIEIPWRKGSNVVYLEYTYGVLALGGKYTFDVALLEKTATIPIEYVAKIKEFLITSEYIGEGTFIIPHTWIKGEDNGKI